MCSLSSSQAPCADSEAPHWLTSSRLLAPFLALSQLQARQMQQWFSRSGAGNLLFGVYDSAIRPLHFVFSRHTAIHQILYWLHLLATVAIFVLATFADTTLIGAAVVGASALLGVRLLLRPIPLEVSVIDLLVDLFFLTAVISTFFSSFFLTSAIGLAKFTVFFLGYLNFRYLMAGNPRVLFILLGLLAGLGLAESFVGLSQHFNRIESLATWQDPTINPELTMTRVFGTLQPSNPNLLAGFLIPCLASAVGLCLYTLFARRWALGVLLALSALIILVGLVLTGSRGGYLSIMGMSAVFFMLVGHLLWHEPELKRYYKLKALWLITLLGSVAAMVAALMFVPALQHRVTSIFAMREDSSNSYRINVWKSTWEMIQHNWLVGIGPGNNTFKQVYGYYMIPGYNALSAYSIFLEMWVEQGIFGLLFFLLLLITVLLRVTLNLYTRLPLGHKILMITLLAGIVGSVVYGLFDTIWYRPSVNLLFWLFVAAAALLSERGICRD